MQQIPAHCKETPNQTTMARAPLNPPGPDKEKAWKVRHQGVICMLAKEVGPSGRLSHELIQRVKVKFSYRNDKSIRTLWKKYKQPILANEGFEIKRSGTSGRHLKYSADDLQNKIRNVPLKQRKTLRSLSHAAGIKHVTLYNYLRRGLIKRSTSSIKPTLTPANIQRRKDHCLSKVGADEHFSNLMEEVHVDEKWFFVDQIDEKFYLLPDEDTPYRSCKHKRHIEKVMFGAAVARRCRYPSPSPMHCTLWRHCSATLPSSKHGHKQRLSRDGDG
jgi:hypothetical protein